MCELELILPALLTEAITFDHSQLFNWSFLLMFTFTMFVCPLLQFSSGMGSSPLPSSFWHQAKRLQGLPWSQHREGEVAGFLKDEKGKRSVCCSIFWEYMHIAAAVVASNVPHSLRFLLNKNLAILTVCIYFSYALVNILKPLFMLLWCICSFILIIILIIIIVVYYFGPKTVFEY